MSALISIKPYSVHVGQQIAADASVVSGITAVIVIASILALIFITKSELRS